ncbi:MAG: aldo/keto reductase, partial [Thermoproteota archaeon]
RRANKILEVLLEIAERRGKDVSQVALNWLIKEPTILAIPGAKRPQHVKVNVGATGWRLTDEEVKKIDEVSSSFKPERLKSYASIPFRLLRFW